MPLIPRLGKPQARVTGTSYSSGGQTDIQLSPDDYNEGGSSARGILFETVPELSSRTVAQQTYTRMYRNSVSVRIGMRAAEAPVVGGDYYIEPFSNEPDDLVIAEFVKFNLFSAPSVPFKRTIRSICNGQYKSGFKVMEKVWELREWNPTEGKSGANRKQYTVLKKLSPRPSDTIQEITYDQNGAPTGAIQNALDPKAGSTKSVTLPIEKIAIFPFEEEDGDLYGNSILRPAFMHYTFLEPLYKIDAIQKERHGIGVPRVHLNQGYNADDKKLAHVIGSNLRVNERAYVVENDRFTVDFIEIEGQLVDALKSAEFHDTMILKAILLQFLNMGVTEVGGGGRNTGATHLDMFLKSMRYVAQSICDIYNHYIIPYIVAYNFDTDQFPTLNVRNIGETKDLQMWATAMANLINAEAIEVDEPTENYIRDQVDFPKRSTPRVATPQPDKVTEVITAKEDAEAGATKNGNIGNDGVTSKIKSGNIGKSPSSGVV